MKNNMIERIKGQLEKIRQSEKITILYACESGSRGWGFPSPDSDWDVRFIYIRPESWYLTIDAKKKESIDLPISDELDISGWDARKAFRLLYSSNATPFEWLQSPIIYKSRPQFRENLFELGKEYFCPKTSIHHYLGIAKSSFLSGIQGDTIKIKKFFYVLRPLLAAMWVQRENGIPPMEFSLLAQPLKDRKELSGMMAAILKKKETAMEGDRVPLPAGFRDFFEEESEKCKQFASQLEQRKNDPEKLNVFFRETLKGD
ncbi:MAG: nucleotidyltransferase domain-containing protein [bacterium]|nr:nucleotidyltransferase domain-containing protein [bacterium]